MLGIAERNRASMEKGGQSASAGSRKFEYGGEAVIELDREPDSVRNGAGETTITVKLSKNRNGGLGQAVLPPALARRVPAVPRGPAAVNVVLSLAQLEQFDPHTADRGQELRFNCPLCGYREEERRFASLTRRPEGHRQMVLPPLRRQGRAAGALGGEATGEPARSRPGAAPAGVRAGGNS